MGKLKQSAQRTYSRVAKPSRFVFNFSPRLKHASWLQVMLGWACSQSSGSSEHCLSKNTCFINYPRRYHKGSCASSIQIQISPVFQTYLLSIARLLQLRAVSRSFQLMILKTIGLKISFPFLSFKRLYILTPQKIMHFFPIQISLHYRLLRGLP